MRSRPYAGGQIQIWNNNLFEFLMIPALPDSAAAF
jgi:hypothetical protein